MYSGFQCQPEYGNFIPLHVREMTCVSVLSYGSPPPLPTDKLQRSFTCTIIMMHVHWQLIKTYQSL